jgi:hypothetical protein
MAELKVRDVPEVMINWLDKEADEKGMSRNKFVVWLLEVTKEEWAQPRPVTVTSPKQAYETARALKKDAAEAPARPDPVVVAPTRDNLPGSRPSGSSKPRYGKPVKEPAGKAPMFARRVLPGDAELYADRDAKMAAVSCDLTVTEQKLPDSTGRYRKCSHDRNVFLCSNVRCKMETSRS